MYDIPEWQGAVLGVRGTTCYAKFFANYIVYFVPMIWNYKAVFVLRWVCALRYARRAYGLNA